MLRGFFFISILIVFVQTNAWAQEQDFGDVSQKIMEMEFYEKDLLLMQLFYLM